MFRKKDRLRLRPFFLWAIGSLVIAEIVALSPSPLEEKRTQSRVVDPDSLIQDSEPTLIPGLPQSRVAEYSVEKFRYVSVHSGEKQWKIDAKRAFLFNPERLVHARKVQAYLYDPENKITVVTGLEAKYFLNQRDLEVFGEVVTTFPDGFEVRSEYLRYQPSQRRIQIPSKYFTQGKGQQSGGQIFQFESMGLDYVMGDSLITLSQAVKVILERPNPSESQAKAGPSPSGSPEPGTLRPNLVSTTEQTKKSDSDKKDYPGVPDRTTIESDRCIIYRNKNLAKFTMNSSRPLRTRFVHITQPTLHARSRRADLNYGNFDQVLEYLSAYEDVLIKEVGNRDALRYATSGQAVFDTQQDIIQLTQYPQVYQDEDTVIGDIILLHRNSDIVEIEHSNAYSQGSEQKDK